MTAYPSAAVVGGNWAPSDPHVPAINAAAIAHGVPPNLLRAVLQRESGGVWRDDANPTDKYGRRRPDGTPNLLLGFGGIYASTAETWGCDFAGMAKSPNNQLRCMAGGLARLNRDYGHAMLPGPNGTVRTPKAWENAVLVYHGGANALTPGGYVDETMLSSRTYAEKALADWRALDALSGGDPMPDLIFGKVPHPPFQERLVTKPHEGAGFTRVPPRQVVGACNHETYGYGDGASYQRFFSAGGERAADALVDYYVDQDGTISRFNDPRGTRAPWANGGSDGLEGDGVAFVRTLGAGAINARLVSVENEGKEDDYTPAQLAANAALCAYWFDQAGVPWDRYPLNPRLGIVTDLEHYEFATKACPFGPKRSSTNRRQDATRAILRQYQTGVAIPGPVPPPGPVEPTVPFASREDVAFLTARFGSTTRTTDGAVDLAAPGVPHRFGYDPRGIISNAWTARAYDDGAFPPIESWARTTIGERDGAPVYDQLVAYVGGWCFVDRGQDRRGWFWLGRDVD